MTRGAFATLTRHFAHAMVSPPILTDLGVDYLRRTLFGLLAILLVVGIFLPRAFFKKYTDLGALVGSDPYLRAVQADTLLMIALPMVFIGLGTVILGPLLFPDETDYQVLTPLPISRAELFAAKLCALALIAFTAVLAVNLIASFWFPLAVSGRKATHPIMARIGAHAVATTAASIWMFVAVMGLQGLSLVAVPAAWQRRLGGALHAGLLVVLLWSLPLVIRMPAMDVTADRVLQSPLAWLPPVWFLGVERWLLDGPAAGGYVRAAQTAGWASAIAVTIVLAVYAVLYRTAERLAGVSGDTRRPPLDRPRLSERLERATGMPAATTAILSFIAKGLARSRLHQFVFLLIAATGIALVIGDALTVTAAPLLVALVFIIGLRASFLWPLDRGAAWVFRVTEDHATRTAVLNGVHVAFVAGATIGPWAIGALLQPAVLGPPWWAAMALTTLAALAAVEFVLIDWLRIPFACTYLPGKKQLAYTLGVLFAAYFIFVLIGSNLIRWSIVDATRTLTTGGGLVAVWAALRRARLRTWGVLPLEFEDVDPFAPQRLGLGTDERPSS